MQRPEARDGEGTPEPYAAALDRLRREPRTWLITGVAGFIGSNLLEHLVRLGQRVVGVDNFATGYRANVEDALGSSGADNPEFRLIEGDISDPAVARDACEGVDIVLHQAALGSVPRSIADPLATNRANLDGSLAMLVAARDAAVDRFVYASSSSVYGDHPGLPKREEEVGRPLSPYAVTKSAVEQYARVFGQAYGASVVGLRYFNVFGRRQDPNGAYAAVIPRWINNILSGLPCEIFGDGETSRDFCYVENVIQANILAAMAPREVVAGEVYNVAVGERTTLNDLFFAIRDAVAANDPMAREARPVYRDFRVGDIRHSLADIGKIRAALGYDPTRYVSGGLTKSVTWYRQRHGDSKLSPARLASW